MAKKKEGVSKEQSKEEKKEQSKEKKEEKKRRKLAEEEEKKRKKKEMKKSRESVLTVDTLDSPRSGECLSSGKKKGGFLKKIRSSFMSPAHSRRGVAGSQSCQNLAPPHWSGLGSTSASSPDLHNEDPTSLKGPPTFVVSPPVEGRTKKKPAPVSPPTDGRAKKKPAPVTPEASKSLPARSPPQLSSPEREEVPGPPLVTSTPREGEECSLIEEEIPRERIGSSVTQYEELDTEPYKDLFVEAEEVPRWAECQECGNTARLLQELGALLAVVRAESPTVRVRNESLVSVEYSMPFKRLSPAGGTAAGASGTEADQSPRSPAKDRRRISFASEDPESPGRRVITPEILKLDLSARLGEVPSPPGSPVLVQVELPEAGELEGLPLEERCEEQKKLLLEYEENIAHFRDQVLEIVAENSKLRATLESSRSEDIATVRRQAQHVLQENRALVKEQQMNQAQWQDLIEERNKEVIRVRNTCTNLEEQNETLQRRCEKLEGKNEELRDAYNSIVFPATQADDFVSVTAHLTAVEGYKTALEELRRRYDENIADRSDEIGSLEEEVATLAQKVELLEEEKSLAHGQVRGLREALERAQRSSTKHKRETVALTARVNALKGSLSQAINIAEQSTLQRLELAEILQISDIQEKQKRSYLKESGDLRVKEVKKIANAKLKSCAEILQEKEVEHERTMEKLYDKISRLKMQCKTKDDMIQSLSGDSRPVSPSST